MIYMIFFSFSKANPKFFFHHALLMYQGLEASKELHNFWMVFSTANVKPALSVVSAICFFKHSSNFEMYD